MSAPVAAADLVADQAVARRDVGNAQQRLGETHQRDAFARIERELEHQRVDAGGTGARGAHPLRERRGQLLRRLQRSGQEGRFPEQ